MPEPKEYVFSTPMLDGENVVVIISSKEVYEDGCLDDGSELFHSLFDLLALHSVNVWGYMESYFETDEYTPDQLQSRLSELGFIHETGLDPWLKEVVSG